MKRAWFYILLSLASADRHGSAIQEDVRELSGGDVRLWPATLYGSLEELRERGWIRPLPTSSAPDPAGRGRVYRLTPDGRTSLRAEVERLESITERARLRLEG